MELLLTKDKVLNEIIDYRKEWESSGDFWFGSTVAFKNAPNGWDVNVIGLEYADVEENEFKCVVTDVKDNSKVIFTFMLKDKETTTYVFNSQSEASTFMDVGNEFHGNPNTILEYAEAILFFTDARDIMNEYEMEDSFGYECEMREYSATLAYLTVEQNRPTPKKEVKKEKINFFENRSQNTHSEPQFIALGAFKRLSGRLPSTNPMSVLTRPFTPITPEMKECLIALTKATADSPPTDFICYDGNVFTWGEADGGYALMRVSYDYIKENVGGLPC